ncbi:hypothetical protein TMatcc_008335 [Talaromyces marneffei ATCC 18224]
MKREEWVAPIPGLPCLTVSNHLRLNFNLVEFLAGVDTDNGSDHLRHNNHVTEMCLDEVGLLVGLGLLLGLAELLDETHRLALQATVETTAGTGVNDITEFLGGEVEESISCQLCSRRVTECWCVRTARARYRGKKTCGTVSSSSTLY